MRDKANALHEVLGAVLAAAAQGMEVKRARYLGDDGEWHDIPKDPDGRTRVRWNLNPRPREMDRDGE